MDPLTIGLIVAAAVVTYGAGFGATWALVRKHGLPVDYGDDQDGDNLMLAHAASWLWPLGLPAALAHRGVRALLERSTRAALPPARLIDNEDEDE